MPEIDLSADLAGLGLEYFWMNGSGPLAMPPDYVMFSGYRTGAVVGKTIDINEIMGNETPNIIQLDPDHINNSIGLSGAGISGRKGEFVECYPNIKKPYIESIKPQETPEATQKMIYLLCGLYRAAELNASCPNVEGGMRVGQDPGLAEQYSYACREAMPGGKPLIFKLTPNARNIGEIALAAVRGGADILSLVNTFDEVGKDYSQQRQALGRPPGGISGRGIKEKALEKVGEVYQAVGDKVPIIGMGGIETVRDAVEFLERGADAVAICTYLFLDRPMEISSQFNPNGTVKGFLNGFKRGMTREFRRLGVSSPRELKGRYFREAV